MVFFFVTYTAMAGVGGSMLVNSAPNPQASESPPPDAMMGLPTDVSEVALHPAPKAIGEEGCDVGSKRIPANIRAIVFQHFVDYQARAKAWVVNKYRDKYDPAIFKETIEGALDRFSLTIARIMVESSGDTSSVTGMNGKEVGTYKSTTNLKNWGNIFGLRGIPDNGESNYGWNQISSDRMVNTSRSPLKRSLLGVFGKDDNAAKKTRALFSLYQKVAQIKGVDVALRLCGTALAFEEGMQGAEGMDALRQAMKSIKTCDAGTAETGFVNTPEKRHCFNSWHTLCPALNFDIAVVQPDAYFDPASRYAAPVCRKTLETYMDLDPKSYPADVSLTSTK
jgi:hypothetical protein